MATPLVLNKPVIAIVGSAGKTTTKEMIASIIQQRWKILKTSGNANAPRHTAMMVKKVSPLHKALVLEYGMSRHGEIKLSCRIIQPNIGVITNIGTAHIGHFNGDIKGIANTKSDLIRLMKPKGILYLNADDNNSKLLDTKNFKGKIVTVSQKNPSDFKAENVKYVKGGMNFETNLNGTSYKFFIPVYGKHNIYNALFAVAVTYNLGFKPAEIQKGLRFYRKPWRRLSVYRLKNNIRIIDDSFSANPNAAKAAIDVLHQVGKGKKIAVLGTMLEMGRYKVKGHKDVGRYLAKKGVDKLFTYGNDAVYIGQGAIESGFPKEKVKNYFNQTKIVKDLLKHLEPNTTILFKASHGMYLNQVIKALINSYKDKF